MSRFMRRAAVVVLILSVGFVVAAVAITAAPGDPLAGATLSVNGEEVLLGPLHAHGLASALVAGLIALVLLVVLPLALLVPVFAVALALALAFIAVAGSVALALAPVLLVGWLVWRLARPRTAVPR